MLRHVLRSSLCVVLALAVVGSASARSTGARRGSGKQRWRIYRVSKTRWVDKSTISGILVRNAQGTYDSWDCTVDVTATGSAAKYYLGTRTGHFHYVLGARTAAGVPKAPVPARFSVGGHLSVTIGHTTCAGGTPAPVDCAGTYSFPLFVAKFAEVGRASWVFSYHPTVSFASVAAQFPASCHPDDPAYSDLPVTAFSIANTGGYGPPYDAPMELDISRKMLLAGKSFTAKSGAGGVGTAETLDVRASLVRVR